MVTEWRRYPEEECYTICSSSGYTALISREKTMSAPIEIEMNLVVKDKKALLEHLAQQVDGVTSRISFNYFGKPNDTSFYVRVEERDEPTGVSYYLTAKGSFTSSDGINQRKEVTLPLDKDDVENCKALLGIVQLETRDTKTKTRHAFKIDGLDVTLDEWDVASLGDRLEIEGTDEAKIKEFAATVSEYCDPEPSE